MIGFDMPMHKTAEYIRFLKNIKKARLSNGFTQGDVGVYLAYSQSVIAKMENGSRMISAVELRELSRLYERPLDYFFD